MPWDDVAVARVLVRNKFEYDTKLLKQTCVTVRLRNGFNKNLHITDMFSDVVLHTHFLLVLFPFVYSPVDGRKTS